MTILHAAQQQLNPPLHKPPPPQAESTKLMLNITILLLMIILNSIKFLDPFEHICELLCLVTRAMAKSKE